MSYQSELDFAKRILSHFRLKTHIITKENHSISKIDMGLRKLLGIEEQYNLSNAFMNDQMKPNTIYKLSDVFYCNYFILRMPDTAPDALIIVGSYTTREFNRNEIMEFTEEYYLPPQIFNTLEKYFNNIPYLENDSTVMIVMNTPGESLWGNMDNFKFETLEQPINAAEHSAQFTAFYRIANSNHCILLRHSGRKLFYKAV